MVAREQIDGRLPLGHVVRQEAGGLGEGGIVLAKRGEKGVVADAFLAGLREGVLQVVVVWWLDGRHGSLFSVTCMSDRFSAREGV